MEAFTGVQELRNGNKADSMTTATQLELFARPSSLEPNKSLLMTGDLICKLE